MFIGSPAGRLRAAALLGLIALGLAGVRAEGASAQAVTKIALTGDIVKAFIASYPTVKKDAETIGKKYHVDTDSDDTGGWGAWMKATNAWGEMNAIVQPYGFADFPTWLSYTTSIATAYEFAKKGAEIDSRIAQATDAIKNNPSLSDAQKQAMLQQMQASMGSMDAMRPPQANIDAITPYISQLDALLDADDNN